MTDRRLRDLERRALTPGSDVPTRDAWVRALARARDPRLTEARAIHAGLHQRRLLIERGVSGCSHLSTRALCALVEACAEGPAGTYRTKRLGGSPRALYGEAVPGSQHHVLALAARVGRRVVLGVGCVYDSGWTPERIWTGLAPWSKRAARAAALAAWCAQPELAPVAANVVTHGVWVFEGALAQLWVELERRQPAAFWYEDPDHRPTTPVLRGISVLDRATRAQRRKVREERARLELAPHVFRPLLRELGGVEQVDDLHRAGADALLDALRVLDGGDPLPADALTSKQVGYVLSLRRRARLDAATFRGTLQEIAGVEDVRFVSKRHADRLIELLRVLATAS